MRKVWVVAFLMFLGCGITKDSDVGGSDKVSQAVSPSPTSEIIPPKELYIPNALSSFVTCRPGTSYCVAYCLNELLRKKNDVPEEFWRITIGPGEHRLKDSIVLLGTKNVDIVGQNDENGIPPTLTASGLPTNRLVHQHFSILILNSTNVTFRNLKLDGADLSAQRGIGVCATPGQVARWIGTIKGHFLAGG